MSNTNCPEIPAGCGGLQAVQLPQGGHQGITNTKNLLHAKVWFPVMDHGGTPASGVKQQALLYTLHQSSLRKDLIGPGRWDLVYYLLFMEECDQRRRCMCGLNGCALRAPGIGNKCVWGVAVSQLRPVFKPLRCPHRYCTVAPTPGAIRGYSDLG
ncbi:hypothetical protein NDU88_002017 [Pleurodeles waltl]|uniref:Uncharacterized protein n=1 Tax=Pleurodeles waltl TaxID=8319 RepID=A0AAV7VY71_PLEWA|nr:hypothetical protein NDU88_002017 [Pleurodeles waltl]